ncbi:mercury(II) reductase [Streptomyces diastaticus]|uniref:Mercuric reductase n=3 Tax=Streptomyces TaxID=1883 RepID=A0ABP7DXX3_9ACTN|nr:MULTISPECIES: mercury(II) reductase [Streptomyces]MBZ3908400.1 mercury(II) reductase [Streptomyces griseiscabiei]MDX2913917.1 mercury(II) reductase [Streptomyces griseiscabiei]GHE39354.1 mercuric reductase MerA [Streptomyces cellulosae]
MSTRHNGFDLAVIGSGGAAFAAAIAARNKGAKVVMVERGATGGTCVNTGCVPSKALLAAAEARHVALAQPFPGIRTEAGPVDFTALISGKQALVEAMRAEKYTDLAAEYGWTILAGTARFASGPVLEVTLNDGGTTTIEAAHYVIATGSAPWAPPIDGLDEAGYLTSTTAMELDHLPESMLVVGGNAIGLEQGQLFARLGTQVTVVEALDRLAPFEEPEVSAMIEDVFTGEGIGVHTGLTVTAVRRDTSGYRLTAARRGEVFELQAEQLLVATGRRPVTDGLALETVGVKTGERGEIIVDEHLRTGNERIWAAGDVTGHPQFVYVAAAHGTLVADNALDGAERTLDYHHLPRVTFTTPAIAAAGLTDAQAVAQGFACDCRILPLEYVPRALVNRDTHGLIKLVAERGTGKLLGVHVIADGGGDVIATAVYALANRMTVHQMADLWCPYLTMAEGLKLAAQTYTRDVSKLSCCAS